MASDESLAFLKISNTQQLSQFLHDCVDDLLGKKLDDYKNYNNDVEWTKDEYDRAKALVQNIYKERVLNDQIASAVVLNEQARRAIEACYEVRKNEIHQAVIEETLLKTESNVVKNIDWKLKWVVGSSTLATLREPLLQVDLNCVGQNSSTVKFEMDLQQLDKFISELESVKSELNNCNNK